MAINKIIFHVDVNSAYLSWSACHYLQKGATIDLRDIPSIVGGSQASRHGIVLAKSTPAKKFKIETGEPVLTAKQKCPNLVVVPPLYFCYMQASKEMFDILREYSDKIQLFSIDEAFIDFTGMEQLFGDPIKTAHKIKDRIHTELGFTVNIGVSYNKLLAKMAGEIKKNNLVHSIFNQTDIEEKLWVLPVRELFGVGRAVEEKLKRFDINTIGDLANTPRAFLKHLFKSYGNVLHDFANGVEDFTIHHQGHTGGNHHTIKGIGNSYTSRFDITSKEDAYLGLLSLIESVCMRLRFGGFSTKVIAVTIKTKELNSYSHQTKASSPVDTVEEMYEICKKVFDEMWRKEPIRHLGIRASDFSTSEIKQIAFFEKDWSKQRIVNKTVDEIRFKFGANSIKRGVFLHSGIQHIQGGISEDYPLMSSIL